MKMNSEIREMLEKMPFVPLVTQGDDGPHIIVVGKGFFIDDETLAFFGWRQGTTSKNIANNGKIQIALVAEKGNKGFRLSGTANIERQGTISEKLREVFPKQLGELQFVTVMKVEQIDSLL
ncbi:MAG: pyridoxamine 5'-phosphate oxidase family protein [Thermodesulfovibrionales bacterium]|jgi:general stress protein 26